MKTPFLTLIVATLVLSSCEQNTSSVKSLKDEKEKVSYGLGTSLSGNLDQLESTLPLEEKANVDDFIKGIEDVRKAAEGKSDSYFQGYSVGVQIQSSLRGMEASDKLDYASLYQGIRDKYNKDSLLVNEDSIQSKTESFFKDFEEKSKKIQEEKQANAKAREDKKKEENTTASAAFLTSNKTKTGVKSTESGLQYEVITAGTGEMPTDNDKVKVIYTGKTIDGKTFDSSKGLPVEMNVNQVVPGFSEGLKMMPKGSKFKLYIPAALGYGEQAPPAIGPNQVLVFDVEVVDFAPIPAEELKQIEAQKQQQAAQQAAMMQQMQAQQAAQQAAPAAH